MQADETMTKQESEEMIKQLEKVFDIVRLLDEETLYGGSGIESEGGEVCQCYSFWGRNEVCENCISLKVMQDKVQRTKLELLGQDFYQVISKYVKIDGKPYVMEMISRLDREVLVDDDGKNQLLSEISGYNDKLYRDALTGVYNRRYFEEKIKKEKVKLFILCSPHNPVGRVWKKDELLKLGQICLKNDVKIISDEIHSDFIYPGHQHHVFASLKTELQNITITCTAPTKTFNLAGLQISNIFIADEKLRLQFKKAIASTGYSQCNLFGLAACQTAYESCSSWLEDLKQYLFENTRFVDEYLKEHIPLIKLIIPEGTYLLWLDFRRLQISDKELNDLLIEHARLWLDSGTMFGKEGKGFQRINIACPRAYLRQALNQLKNALEEIEY